MTTDSLKVTLSISCKTGRMPGFISWAEWQIQYNASLRSEHFTLGPSMWPWFRWMSTSHLYSSNQQSFTETHAHTQLHWLSHAFSVLCSLITQLRRVRERKAKTERLQSRGDLLPYQAVPCTPAVRESVTPAAAVWCLLTLLFVHSVK